MKRTALILPTVLLLAFAGPAPAQDEAVMELCAECHEEAAAALVDSPHGRLMARQSPETLEKSCNACHGPADKHLEEFDTETIHRRPEPEACRTCHTDKAAGMRRTLPAHSRHDVACLDCHDAGHAAAPAEPLLAAEPRELCGSCHAAEKAMFSRPFAHKEGHEPFACTACHDAHDSGSRRGEETGRWAALGNGGMCIACHTDMAGPFVFPHAPREVDGCVTCHEPHGSVNPRLLVRRTTFSLCLECHANVPTRSFHDFSQTRYRACQKCHRAVHGSDVDPRFLDD